MIFTARLKLLVDSPMLWSHIQYRMFSVKRGWLDKAPQNFEVKNNGAYGITKIYECNKDEQISCEVNYGPNKKVYLKIIALKDGSFDQSCQKLPSSTASQNPDFSNKKEIKVPSKPIPKAIIFFIGGAGDKRPYALVGPNENVMYVRKDYLKRKIKDLSVEQQRLIVDDRATTYLGYYEVFKEKNLKTNVLDKIPNKNILIYLIGHSLGGWNAAHLSDILTKKGYHVKMLITLDPVGTLYNVKAISDIYWDYPKGSADSWINFYCDPKDWNFSDIVADLGGQWNPRYQKPTYNVYSKASHVDAELICGSKVTVNKTGLDLLMDSLKEFVN